MKTYAKFLAAGVINAVVDLVILNVLLVLSPSKSSLDILMFNTIAVVCAIVSSYCLNRYWTFSRQATGGFKEVLMFIAQALVNLSLNDSITVFSSRFLIFNQDVPIFVSSNLSKGLAMCISSTCTYLFLKSLVFRKK